MKRARVKKSKCKNGKVWTYDSGDEARNDTEPVCLECFPEYFRPRQFWVIFFNIVIVDDQVADAHSYQQDDRCSQVQNEDVEQTAPKQKSLELE